MQATTIGLDIAKTLFQVHGIDARGRVVLRKRLRRAQVLTFFANLPRCVIGLEACGGAHYWARELIRLGHDARLMPPQDVKPYVKTNKHDVADAEACCEAVQRPSMRFVPVKTEAQQATLMLHRVRDQLIGQRTATINALRGHLAELGIVAAQSQAGLRQPWRCSASSRTSASRGWPGRCCSCWQPRSGRSKTRSPASTAAWSRSCAAIRSAARSPRSRARLGPRTDHRGRSGPARAEPVLVHELRARSHDRARLGPRTDLGGRSGPARARGSHQGQRPAGRTHRPNGWQQPRPPCQKPKRAPCRAGGVHGWTRVRTLNGRG